MARVRNRATRRDLNHKEIVEAFRRFGFEVLDVSGVPNAFDILISLNGYCIAIEIKSKRTSKLTDGEQKFKERWLAPYEIVYDVNDVSDIALYVRSLKPSQYEN